MIKIENVYKSYGQLEVIKGINMTVKKGEVIQPKHIMALTTLGIKNIKVKKKPKVTFISTGNEIVDYKFKKILPWQVRNSNNHYIKSFIENLNFSFIDGGTIKDDEPKKLIKILKIDQVLYMPKDL